MRHFESIHIVSKKPDSGPAREHELLHRVPAKSDRPTPRELEVEGLLCRGYSQENIAAIFGRSVRTVSVHVTSLYRKRGVHTQVELLLAYLRREGIFVFPEESRHGASSCATLGATQ